MWNYELSSVQRRSLKFEIMEIQAECSSLRF